MITLADLDVAVSLSKNDKTYGVLEWELLTTIELAKRREEKLQQRSLWLCYYVHALFEHKYESELSENEVKKLACNCLRLNYFEFSDLLHKAKKIVAKTEERVIRKEYTAKGRLTLSLQQERDRQDLQARTGSSISPEEYKTYVEGEKTKVRRQKMYKGKPSKAVSEAANIMATYKETALQSYLVQRAADTTDSAQSTPVKIGGHPLAMQNEALPKDEKGESMHFVASVDLAALRATESTAILPHSGTFCFYLASTAYSSFAEGQIPFAVQYYKETSSLASREDQSARYVAASMSIEAVQSFPLSPWPAAVTAFDSLVASDLVDVWADFHDELDAKTGSLVLGYGANVELMFLNENGANVIDELDDFLPLLYLKSYCINESEGPVFGDGGAIGFFIRKHDWVSGQFGRIAFGFYS